MTPRMGTLVSLSAGALVGVVASLVPMVFGPLAFPEAISGPTPGEDMSTVLSVSDIAMIARYSQLKAFVCDYGQDEVPSFYSTAERRAFRKDFTFPIGINMWLARTFGTHGVFYGAYSKPPLKTPKRFHIYIFMVSIGQLVIQVMSARWTKKSNRKYAAPPNLTQASFWERFLFPSGLTAFPRFLDPRLSNWLATFWIPSSTDGGF